MSEAGTADAALAQDWLDLLHAQAVDFTLGWRRLADAAAGDESTLRALFTDPQPLHAWLVRWRARCALDAQVTPEARAAAMRRASPCIIARNHQVEMALEAATEHGDLAPFERLLAALRDPFEERAGFASYVQPAPASLTASYRTFCGT